MAHDAGSFHSTRSRRFAASSVPATITMPALGKTHADAAVIQRA
jgi:hypothetical protein